MERPFYPPMNYTHIVLRLEEIGEMALDGVSGWVRKDFPARLCREVASCTQERVTLLLAKPGDAGALRVSMDAEKQTLPVQFGCEPYGILIFTLFQQEPALQEQELAGTRLIARTCAELLRYFELSSLVFNASPLPDQLAIASLTRRQLQVFRLICQEYSLAEISRQLQITLGTAQKHRQQAYDKLGVGNDLDARCLAFRAGLFSPLASAQNTSDQDSL